MVYENTMNNKRKSFNQDNDNYQGGGKFKRSQDFGNRAPFIGNQNKSPFNRGNGGNSFNQRNRGGNNSFNRNNRGNNNSFNKGFNNRQNFGGYRKSWQNDNDYNNKPFNKDDSLENKNDSDKSSNEDDNMENKSINENAKVEINKNVDDVEESDSSESEEEIVLKDNIVSQNDSETSESEEEVVIDNMNEADSSESSSAEEEHEIIKEDFNESKSEINNGNDDNSESSDSEDIDGVPLKVSKIQGSPSKNNSNEINTSQTQNVMLEGQTIVVTFFSPAIDSNLLKTFFSRYGEIRFIKDRMKTTNLKFFTFYVCYEKPEDALQALEVNGMSYMKSTIEVAMWSATRNNFVHERDFTNAVIIENIADGKVNSQSLRETFNHCGIINEVCIRKHRNCAILWLDSEDAVELALAMDKTLVGDRLLYVQTVDRKKVKINFAMPPAGFKNYRQSFNKSPRFQTRPMQNQYMGRSPRPRFINTRY